MNFNRVAIVGADCISVSIALGLRAQNAASTIAGYLIDQAAEDVTRVKGAFDQVSRRIDRVVRGADLVIVSVPLYAVRDVFHEIAPHLQPGCLVTDTARLKEPVMRWAGKLLPEKVAFVGGHPVPNPAIVGLSPLDDLREARADLLKQALYCFTPPPATSDAVIGAFAGLAEALEAQPFFIGVTEHDGLQAGIEELPNLLSFALLLATVDAPGWQEMRKFAGYSFATMTEATVNVHERHAAIFFNRENVLLHLNGLLSELVRLRNLLAEGDEEAIEKILLTAAQGRATWIEERRKGIWAAEGRNVKADQIPTPGERVGRMFVGEHLLNRLREGPDHSRREG